MIRRVGNELPTRVCKGAPRVNDCAAQACLQPLRSGDGTPLFAIAPCGACRHFFENGERGTAQAFE